MLKRSRDQLCNIPVLTHSFNNIDSHLEVIVQKENIILCMIFICTTYIKLNRNHIKARRRKGLSALLNLWKWQNISGSHQHPRLMFLNLMQRRYLILCFQMVARSLLIILQFLMTTTIEKCQAFAQIQLSEDHISSSLLPLDFHQNHKNVAVG